MLHRTTRFILVSIKILIYSGCDELIQAFLSVSAMPAKAKADAVHLAVATAHRVDYLLTWNCKHLANAEILLRLRPLAEQRRYRMPMVCRPLQLMGEIEYED